MHGGLAIGQQALIETGIAGQSAIDLDHRFTPARQQALAQHGQIHGQQEHDQVGVTLASVLQVPARAIDQHVLPCRQPVVDVARNAIGQAVSAPAKGKGALGLHFGELLHADTQRRFPTDSAERVMTRCTIRQPRSASRSRAASSRLSLPEPEGPMR